jgi:hypothetical protein
MSSLTFSLANCHPAFIFSFELLDIVCMFCCKTVTVYICTHDIVFRLLSYRLSLTAKELKLVELSHYSSLSVRPMFLNIHAQNHNHTLLAR